MTLVEKNFQSDQYANIIVVVDNQQMHLKFTISNGKVEFYKNKRKKLIWKNLQLLILLS